MGKNFLLCRKAKVIQINYFVGCMTCWSLQLVGVKEWLKKTEDAKERK